MNLFSVVGLIAFYFQLTLNFQQARNAVKDVVGEDFFNSFKWNFLRPDASVRQFRVG